MKTLRLATAAPLEELYYNDTIFIFITNCHTRAMIIPLKNLSNGFSFAEVLISLILLSILAIFALPKLLIANTSYYNTIAKEDIAAISNVFLNMKLKGNIKPNTSALDILSQLNHLGQTTTHVHDTLPTLNLLGSCSSPELCFLMPNGSIIYVTSNFQFRELSNDSINDGNNYALVFGIDPNASRSSATVSGPEKSLNIYMYYDGQIRSLGNVLPRTSYYSPTLGLALPSPDPTPSSFAQYDPQWFAW